MRVNKSVPIFALALLLAACSSSTDDQPAPADPSPTNRAPIARDIALAAVRNASAALHLDCTDPDGDPLTYTVTTNPAHGAITGSGANRTYTPTTGYFGPDTSTYTCSDGTTTSNQSSVTITVASGDPPPSAVTFSGGTTLPESCNYAIRLLATDNGIVRYVQKSGVLPPTHRLTGNEIRGAPVYVDTDTSWSSSWAAVDDLGQEGPASELTLMCRNDVIPPE